MGRLQDQQYHSSQEQKPPPDNSEQMGKEELLRQFCPPVDSTVVEFMWLEPLNYQQKYNALQEMAMEANKVLQFQDADDVSSDCTTTATTATTSTGAMTFSSSTPSNVDQNDVDFLSSCFPSIAMSQVLATLQSQHYDVSRTADVLSNLVFLDESFLQPDNDDILQYGIRPTGKGKAKKGKKRSNQTGHQQKVLLSTSANAHGSAYFTPPAWDLNGADSSTSSNFNYWDQHNDVVYAIQQVFHGITHTSIPGYVHRSQGNLIAAVVLLMESRPATQPQPSWPLASYVDPLADGMAAVLIDRTPLELRRIATGVLIQSNHDHNQNQMIEQGIDFAIEHAQRQREQQERFVAMRQEHRLRQNKPSTYHSNNGDLPALPDYLQIHNRDTYSEDNPEHCRMMAVDLWLRRAEYIRKACESYTLRRNKGPGESGTAAYYSDEARELETEAKYWDTRAAKALIRVERLNTNDDHLVDLHGLKVDEARKLVQECLTQWWSRSQTQIARRKVQPLKIITGTGNHSHGGAPKLLPTVQKILKGGGWLYDVPNPGCFHVKGVINQ
ncbi:hypothetical protein DM01DRAFT_1407768 [Hesseltinella vesiculosa]|uniref:Smr domain-containing protein n=1 Tax=Hesseltinella vesiculosa TaxID=101127 RepID=A0A1X2GH26_9FUNG|nr:hypothetical protein DM01DRAFT_1407768 [Hesseltinella vesiculosa]